MGPFEYVSQGHSKLTHRCQRKPLLSGICIEVILNTEEIWLCSHSQKDFYPLKGDKGYSG